MTAHRRPTHAGSSRARVAAAALACLLTLCIAGTAAADRLTFGAPLTTIPTWDTANGWDTGGDSPAPRYDAIQIPAGTETHNAEDLSVWNTDLASGSAAARTGGQILDVRVEGCAIQEDGQTGYGGIPSNLILFQTLTPDGDGTYAGGPPSGRFYLPWCSNSSDPRTGAVSTSTVTTFQPLRECIGAGGLVSIHDVGGFVPAGATSPDYYGNGVPLDILGRVQGSSTQSYVGYPQPAVFGPSDPSGTGYGFGSETNLEVELQVVEGTAGDASIGCPGGSALEAADSNSVTCDVGTSAYGYPDCYAPRLAHLALSRDSVRRGTGLVVAYDDTQAGSTTLAAFKDFFGRRGPSRCVVRPTRAERHNQVCHFWWRAAVFHHRDATGANRVRLETSHLAVGTYQLKLVTTHGGRRSNTLVKTFHVLTGPARRHR